MAREMSSRNSFAVTMCRHHVGPGFPYAPAMSAMDAVASIRCLVMWFPFLDVHRGAPGPVVQSNSVQRRRFGARKSGQRRAHVPLSLTEQLLGLRQACGPGGNQDGGLDLAIR